MMPPGRCSNTWLVRSWPLSTSVEKPCPRSRRAMSWVYCEPKSRMQIIGSGSFDSGVVGRLCGDGYVVDVALAQSERGDAAEPRLALQLHKVVRADVAHAGPQTAE